MKFIKNTIFTILVIFYPFVSFSADANSKEENSTKEWVYNHRQPELTRPANFYRIEKSLNDSICNEALEKLNEEASISSKTLAYDSAPYDVFIKNSSILDWKMMEERDGSNGFIPLEEIKYKSGGSNLFLYRFPFWRPSDEFFFEVYSMSYSMKDYIVLGGQLSWQIRLRKEGTDHVTRALDLDDLNVSVMHLKDKELYLLVLSKMQTTDICDQHFDIALSLLTEKRYEPTLCHIKSIPKIKCEKKNETTK